MYYGLLDSVLQYLVLPTHIKVIEKVLLPFGYVVLLHQKIVHVLEVFVKIEFFHEHCRVFHRKRFDAQTELISELSYHLHLITYHFSFRRISYQFLPHNSIILFK